MTSACKVCSSKDLATDHAAAEELPSSSSPPLCSRGGNLQRLTIFGGLGRKNFVDSGYLTGLLGRTLSSGEVVAGELTVLQNTRRRSPPGRSHRC